MFAVNQLLSHIKRQMDRELKKEEFKRQNAKNNFKRKNSRIMRYTSFGTSAAKLREVFFSIV